MNRQKIVNRNVPKCKNRVKQILIHFPQKSGYNLTQNVANVHISSDNSMIIEDYLRFCELIIYM